MVMAAVGGAIAGGVVNGIFGSHSQKKAQEANSITSKFNELNNISGGQLGKYAENYAYRSPSEQGRMARDKMNSMFPELNPWELSGSQASGVSAAVGQEANSATGQQAQVAADAALKQQNINAQMQMNRDTIKGNILSTAIRSGVDYLNAKNQNETAKDVAQTNITPQLELLDANKDKIISETNRNVASKALTQQQLSTEIINTVKKQAEVQGQNLTNDQIAALTEKVKAEVDRLPTSGSKVGAVVTDVKNGIDKVVNSLSGNSGSNGSPVEDGLKWLGERWDSAFKPSPRTPDPRSRSSLDAPMSKNNVRTYQ